MEEKYLSLKEASEICEYSQEYLSLRARQGKLKAVKMGRNWVTKKEWVEEYIEKVHKSSIIDLSNISNEIKIPTIRFGFLFSFAFILLLSTLLFFGKNSYGEVSYKTLNYVKASINGELSENEKFSKLDIEEKKELKKSYSFQKPEETIKDFFSSFSTVTSSSVSGSKKLLFSVFKKIDNIVFEFGRSGDFLIFKTADSFSSAFSEAKYFLKKTESSGKKIARNFTGGIYYMGEDISDSANKFFLGIKKTSSNISRNVGNIFYSSFDSANIFVSSFFDEVENIKEYAFSVGRKISSGAKNVTLSALKGGVSISESLSGSAKSLVKGAEYAKEQARDTTTNIGKNISSKTKSAARSFSTAGVSTSESLNRGPKSFLNKVIFFGQGIETFIRDFAG